MSTTSSAINSFDIGSVAVPEDYKGPRLSDDGQVTSQFVDQLIEHFKAQQRLPAKYVYMLIAASTKLFSKEESLVDLEIAPANKFTICGDIHGQFFDLLNIFRINGMPSEQNPYLFNGDIVNRGSFSVECLLLILALKLLHPRHFYYSRGNHECEPITKMYGFNDEVSAKYPKESEKMLPQFFELFHSLPLAHCFNKKVLVVHGGLCEDESVTVEDIRKMDRFHEVEKAGAMTDLLWSDPRSEPGRGVSPRGVSCIFGPDVTEQFCRENQLDYIIRSHELVHEGYAIQQGNKCVTVFSAPNYCGISNNKGAIVTIRGDDLTPKFTQYEVVPQPKVEEIAGH